MFLFNWLVDNMRKSNLFTYVVIAIFFGLIIYIALMKIEL